MTYLSLILIAVMLAGCATTAVPTTEADRALSRINAERMRNYTPDPPAASTAGQDFIKAILLLPITVPLAAITSYPRYRGVHCKSYTYKDAYHTRCY